MTEVNLVKEIVRPTFSQKVVTGRTMSQTVQNLAHDVFTPSSKKLKSRFKLSKTKYEVKFNKHVARELKNRLKEGLFFCLQRKEIKKAINNHPELKQYKNNKYLLWTAGFNSTKSFEKILNNFSEAREAFIKKHIKYTLKIKDDSKIIVLSTARKKDPIWLKKDMNEAIKTKFFEEIGMD